MVAAAVSVWVVAVAGMAVDCGTDERSGSVRWADGVMRSAHVDAIPPLRRRPRPLSGPQRAALAARTPAPHVHPSPTVGGLRGQLAALRECESGDDPTAISPSGTYRGLYQFDLQTWRSVGGAGDPAAAPRHVQTEMALRLQARRGWQPWPSCSRQLGLR